MNLDPIEPTGAIVGKSLCACHGEPRCPGLPKVLLVGEDNPYHADPKFALYPLPERATGHRLQSLVMGISRGEYLRRFDRANLCSGKWSMKEARERAAELLKGEWSTYVLLGKKVRTAFGFGVCASFTSAVYPDTGKKVVLLPHPSGLCREWNAEAFERAKKLLRLCGVLS